MRFYFHLVGPSGAISDDTGLEALSLEVAEVEVSASHSRELK